jgi:hypothetical protein
MTLRECLESLPRNMRLRDLASAGSRIVTVQEVLDADRHLNESGYEVLDQRYALRSLKAIYVAGMAAYREAI